MTVARRFFAICLLVGLWAGQAVQVQARCEDWVPQPKPQNAGRDIVGQELDEIIDRGWIGFAVYDDYPPYSFEEKGKPRGIDIEIGRLVADELGVEPRFKFVGAGENLETDLRNNLRTGALIGGAVSNVMLRVPYDSAFTCRVEQVVFTGQYMTEGIAIAYRKELYPEEKPVPAYFRFDTVAVENDSIADFYLTSLAGGQLGANIRRFPAMEDAMQALASGEVAAAMGPRAQLDYGLTADLDVHQPPLPGFAVGNWTIGLGVNFRYRPLGYAIDDAIYSALSDGRIAAIFESYGLSFTPPER
jgi:ABC-type amino acid transport substrate-binding protein